MKLPLQYGRFSTLKRLAVYIGSLNAATRQEQWTELGGVAALIDGSKGIAPLRITAEVSATQASHVRIRVPPTEAGKAITRAITGTEDAGTGNVSVAHGPDCAPERTVECEDRLGDGREYRDPVRLQAELQVSR